MSIAENMNIQIFFHISDPRIGNAPSDKAANHQTNSIPDFRKMRGNDAADHSGQAKGQTGHHRSFQIIEIV